MGKEVRGYSYRDDFTTDAITGDETDPERASGHCEGEEMGFRLRFFFRERKYNDSECGIDSEEKGLLGCGEKGLRGRPHA